MKKLLIVVFSMVSSLCLFPQPMEDSVDDVSILLKNEVYLDIKSIDCRYENNKDQFFSSASVKVYVGKGNSQSLVYFEKSPETRHYLVSRQ